MQNNIFFVYVHFSLEQIVSVTLSYALCQAAKQSRTRGKSNQSHCREQKQFKADENYSHSTKTIRKSSLLSMCIFLAAHKKAFLSKVHLKVFYLAVFFKHGKFECVGEFSPHFPCC
jgi:hypothetical protein